MATLWYATQAEVKIGTASVGGLGSSETMATYITGLADEKDFSSFIKDVKVSGGGRDAEAVKFFGYNEAMHKKRAEIIECAMTLKHEGGHASTIDTATLSMGAKQSVTGNYVRATGGEKASNDRPTVAVSIKLTDGTNVVNLLLDQAVCASREMSLEADGHAEETLTFKCLASTYYEEDDFA